jgi:hypothetical protein
MCISVSSVLEGRGGCRVCFTSGGRVEGEEGGGGERVGGVRGWVSLLLSPAQSSCLTLRLILGGRLISDYYLFEGGSHEFY